jgi:hypothetical protein
MLLRYTMICLTSALCTVLYLHHQAQPKVIHASNQVIHIPAGDRKHPVRVSVTGKNNRIIISRSAQR